MIILNPMQTSNSHAQQSPRVFNFIDKAFVLLLAALPVVVLPVVVLPAMVLPVVARPPPPALIM